MKAFRMACDLRQPLHRDDPVGEGHQDRGEGDVALEVRDLPTGGGNQTQRNRPRAKHGGRYGKMDGKKSLDRLQAHGKGEMSGKG